MKKIISQLLLLVSAMFLVACGDDGGGGGRVTVGGPGNASSNGGVLNQSYEQIINSVNSSQSKSSINFTPDFNDATIDQKVLQMLFPAGNPTYSVQGVQSIEMHIDLNKQGWGQLTQEHINQNLGSFQMYLKVMDNLAYGGQPPIYFALGRGTARSASVNGTTVQIVFGDNYGQIRLSIENGQARLYFTNNGQAEQMLGTGYGSL